MEEFLAEKPEIIRKKSRTARILSVTPSRQGLLQHVDMAFHPKPERFRHQIEVEIGMEKNSLCL